MNNKDIEVNSSSESSQKIYGWSPPQWFSYHPLIVIPAWIIYFITNIIILKLLIDLTVCILY
jgi:hypothetical protein